MSRRFKSVSALQGALKNSLVEAIENKIIDYCIKVARKNIQARVYDTYTPQGENAYDRTFDLLNSVSVGNFTIGTKFLKFDVFMDADKITPRVRDAFDSGAWNAHASVDPIDVSEYIPLWIEEGTNGSLWDRDGAFYMEATHFELDDVRTARELADYLRREGWDITFVR